MFLRIRPILLLACLLLQPAMAAGSKKGDASVSFHLQAEQGDAPKMVYPMMVGDKQVAFKRAPEIQTQDVAGFQAIPCKDKPGIYDVVVLLKPTAAKRLQMITNAHRGRFMTAQLNGRPGEAMIINQQVDDGKLVIWGVAGQEDVKLLSKAFKGSIEIE